MAFKQKLPAKTKSRHAAQQIKGAAANDSSLPSGYRKVLEDIKVRVHAARIRASLSVNRELILL